MVEYRASSSAAKPQMFDDNASPLVKMFSIPLVFEPGEGFACGGSIHWSAAELSSRAGG